MTIVAPGTSFTVKFIPKDEIAELASCVLINKNTNVSTTLVLNTSIVYYDNDYYAEADITHTVAEGEFYKYSVYTDQSVLSYVGSIFVTSQSDYSINNGNYTENTTSNEYITR